jgi:Leucine-rich repeat (LRR) protein
VYDTEPLDLSPIAELENLEMLSIDGPLALNLAPLRKLSKLTSLSLQPNFADFTTLMRVQDIAALGELHELRKLRLEQILVTDLSFMHGLGNLTEFAAIFIPFSNINGIEGCVALTSVTLVRTSVVDISALLRLPNLTDVYVAYTPARSDVLTELQRHGVKVHP